MSRICSAGVQLIEEVTDLGKTVQVRAVDKPDGYGYHRAVSFDARTSKWLCKVMEVIEDPRITGVDYEGRGRLVVHFVGDTRADFRTPYGVEKIFNVLTS